MMLSLRQYQRDSIDAQFAYWAEGGRNSLIVIPTGGGKSLIIAALLQELLEQYPLMRVGIITHTKELIAQNYQELLRVWAAAPAGIYSAGIGRRDTRAAIIFMGIQSVWDKTHILGRFDLILVDEADLIGRNAATMYGKFFASLREGNDELRVTGLTATPFRLDSGRLDEGDDKFFDKIVYEANVVDLIHQGFLSALVSKSAKAHISVKGVHRRGGEFIGGELEAAAMRGDLVQRAAAEIAHFGANRRAWMAFCSGVDHSNAVRDALRALGINAESVDGTMLKGERDGIIRRFREGQVRCLTSVNVLSVGFNVPNVDLIALLRPTASARLYIQQVGRGFRLAEGKENCLVLDFAGNVKRHGPIDMVEDNERQASEKNEDDEDVGGEIAAKVCPQCQSLMPIRVMECRDCGHIWEPETKHEAEAAIVPIMSGRTLDGWFPVTAVSYDKHFSNRNFEAPPTFKVTYHTSRKAVREWLCFSHAKGSKVQRIAESFWLQMGGRFPVPESVDAALARTNELRPIESIKYEKDGEFDRVKGRRFVPITQEGAA